MVNFVFAIDPDSKRRSTFVQKARAAISPVEGLTVSSVTNNDFCAVWATGDWAPVSVVDDEEGAAIIFGDAIGGTGAERLTAAELRHLWSAPRLPEALNGFHAAASYSPRDGLIVGADLLGLFPVCYYTFGDVVLIGSSIDLFRHHPSFHTRLNLEGLVGIFLTKGVFNGQTLFSGVRRLGPGCLLVYRDLENVREVSQFKLPASERYFGLTLSEQIEILDQAICRSILRHVSKGKRHCLMLSGGLDSSLLAGYLKKSGSNIIAVTEGIKTDNEMRSAELIAGALGFRHVRFNVGYLGYRRCAELAVKWQGLQDGTAGSPFWAFYPHLRRISTRVISGFIGDNILGSFNYWVRSKKGEALSFEEYFKTFNNMAFRPEILRRLLKDRAHDLVGDVLRKIGKVYEGLPGRDFQRIWCFSLNHRARFHAGSGLWILSFGSWPILPYVDREVLETAGGMPNEAFVGRRLEKQLFIKKFSKLAGLPLSSNSFDSTPLMPTYWQKGAQLLYGDVAFWRSEILSELRTSLFLRLRGERRYWRRTATGFDSPGWRAIRKMAEPHLELTSCLLDSKTVRKLLPDPEASYIQVQRRMRRVGLTDVSSLKLLIGFALWLRKNSDLVTN